MEDWVYCRNNEQCEIGGDGNENKDVFCSLGSTSSPLEIHISSELQDREEAEAGAVEETLRQ